MNRKTFPPSAVTQVSSAGAAAAAGAVAGASGLDFGALSSATPASDPKQLVRSVLETAKQAKQKNLTIVSGLCWRYDLGVRATMDQIKSGAIGDIAAIQENYLTGTLWHRGRKDDWSEME